MKCFKNEKLSYQSRTPFGLLDTIYQNYLNLKESKRMKNERGQMSQFDFFNSPVNQITKDGPKVFNYLQRKVTVRKDGITLAELRKHNKRHDAWMSINYKVYDVTDVICPNYQYIDRHPGKDTILRGIGKEATKLFGNF